MVAAAISETGVLAASAQSSAIEEAVVGRIDELLQAMEQRIMKRIDQLEKRLMEIEVVLLESKDTVRFSS